MTYVIGDQDDLDAEIACTPVPSLGITMHFKKSYPFTPPIIMVEGEASTMKFIKQFRDLQPLISWYNLVLPCVCCSDLVYAWSPCYGIRDVLDEYVAVSQRLNALTGYMAVMKRLPFDDLVHRRVLLHF
jgi:hypothetical protein